MTRGFARRVARGLALVLLSAQMAVAAYACPMLSPGAGAKATVAASSVGEHGMAAAASAANVECADMGGITEPVAHNLCAEHCRQGHQSDHAPSLTVPIALLTALYAVAPVPEPAMAPRPAASSTRALAAAAPPHAILHCCFRI